MNESTNRIEKQILLKAPRSKVWRALTEPQEFGAWFGVHLTGPSMAAGQHLSGNVTYTGYEHVVLEIWIEKIEPERYLSWRWHPAAIEPGVDYSAEPKTLVEFDLLEVQGGTLFKVAESGFDGIPLARRAKVFGMNTRGWEEQMMNIGKHVDKT
jgi:uncharacterized protein YndB with AHSA1/START domain